MRAQLAHIIKYAVVGPVPLVLHDHAVRVTAASGVELDGLIHKGRSVVTGVCEGGGGFHRYESHVCDTHHIRCVSAGWEFAAPPITAITAARDGDIAYGSRHRIALIISPHVW